MLLPRAHPYCNGNVPSAFGVLLGSFCFGSPEVASQSWDSTWKCLSCPPLLLDFQDLEWQVQELFWWGLLSRVQDFGVSFWMSGADRMRGKNCPSTGREEVPNTELSVIRGPMLRQFSSE